MSNVDNTCICIAKARVVVHDPDGLKFSSEYWYMHSEHIAELVEEFASDYEWEYGADDLVLVISLGMKISLLDTNWEVLHEAEQQIAETVKKAISGWNYTVFSVDFPPSTCDASEATILVRHPSLGLLQATELSESLFQ